MAQTLLEAPSLGFVCFFGIAVVFAGLVLLIALVYLMNFISDRFDKSKAPKNKESAPVVSAGNDVIPNREELTAAICTAIAEEEGTDISAIRVISIKKVN